MYSKILLIVVLLFLVKNAAIAQTDFLTADYSYDVYNWTDYGNDIEITAEDSLYAAVILLDNSVYEFRTHRADKSLKGYATVHRKIRINTEEGLQKLNKVYIPVKNKSEILKFSARSIDSEGNVRFISQSKLKDISNVEEFGSFKIFAIDGAQVGGIIEYVYSVPVDMRYSSKEYAQSDVPIKKFGYYLKGTRDVHFNVTANNGLSRPKYEEKGNFNLFVVEEENIPALMEEEQSAFRAERMNLDVSLKDIYGFEYDGWNYVKNGFTNLVEDLGSRSSYDLNLYMDKYANYVGQTKADRLRLLEDEIKRDIKMVDGGDRNLSDVRIILKDKNANKLGFIKFFAAVLKKLDFEFELLATVNRFDEKFRKNVPALVYAREFVFYIPELDAYLSPTDLRYRLGMAPFMIAGNTALVIDKGNKTNFRYIKINTKEDNLAEASYVIDFSEGFANPTLEKTNKWYGHRGSFYRYSYFVTPTDKKEEFRKSASVSGAEGIEHISSTVENSDTYYQDPEPKPFILQAQLDVSGLSESVGRDYIFNIGQIIGSQSELYQETERRTPIMIQHPIQYLHHIKFAIPNGYSVEGLEDVVRDRNIEDKSGTILGQYVAGYEIQSDTVVITISEFYDVIEFPVSQYESYRAVINSAADFNKMSLLFVKQEENGVEE